MSEITLNVNGKEITASENELLIKVLNRSGIDIAHFCYHDALGADGNCRMCMVEITGQKRPQIACDTFVKAGMNVHTKGEKIDRVRRNILELELINHPVDCPVCDQAGECKLQDYYMDYGLYDSHISKSEKVHHHKHVDVGSNVMLDQERCVLCARCTRFTSDITQTHELGIIGRGDQARVSTMLGRKLDNPYAMNVVDLCPVGALTSKDFRFAQRVWFLTSTPSVCHGCATGCNIYIDHNREKYKDAKTYRFRPRKNMDINGHFICDTGRLSYKELQEKRQLQALYEGEAVDIAVGIEHFHTLLSTQPKQTVILCDANLYLEELTAIAEFAQRLKAILVCPMACYDDASFGDTWLKSSQRAANAAAIEKLGIEQDLPLEIDLLINFNHPDFSLVQAQRKVSFQTHTGFEADITFPLAVFSESAGTLINKAGISQWCEKAIERRLPIPSVTQWITMIDGKNV